jgi:hypothetical protein
MPRRLSWPVAIAAACGLYAAAMIGFVVFSLSHREELVAPDYYEQGIRHDEHIGRVQKARELTGDGALAFDEVTRTLTLRLPPGAAGTLTLYRPSAAALDRRFRLSPDTKGVQTIALADCPRGFWRARAEWSAGDATCFSELPVTIP